MNQQNKNKENKVGKLIALGFFLLVYAPWLAIPLAVLAIICFTVYKTVIQPAQSGGTEARGRAPRNTDFDDCPQPLFCSHKDKGEHHVKRGKERDPWDRPDTDISKYQRRR